MKTLSLALRLSLIILMTGVSTLRAQWNTLNHDATINRSISDVFFVSSTGYACGSRADAVSWGTRGLIYKTIDGGQTWSTISLPLSIGSDSVMQLKSVHFLNANNGYAAATCYTTNGSVGLYYGAILKTTDGGNTWTTNFSTKSQVNYSTTSTVLLNEIQFTSTYEAYVAGQQGTSSSNNGISYHTYNGGNTWTQIPVFAGSQANAVHFVNSSVGCIAGGQLIGLSGPYNGRIARSTDGGNTWGNLFSDPGYGYADIHFPSSQIGYAVGDSMYFTLPGDCKGKLVKTTNGGVTWTAINYFQNFRPFCVFFTSDLDGYIGGETASGNSGLLRTNDGGITWSAENYPDINNSVGSFISTVTFSTPVTGYASNGYTNSNSIYGNFLNSTCSVFVGPDTTFCQQVGQLYATPGTPGNDYVFSWSPGIGLSDSTSQSPTVSFVHNQQYVVTMTDTVTNCVATDTIVVSAYNYIIGTVYSCFPDSALLDFGPGATFYYWQYFTDTNSTTSFLNIHTQTIWATEPGVYSGYATFTGCGALTSVITVVDSCAAAFSCAVDAGPDTVFCQQQGQLFATPASAGNYTYSWSPANGLSNPNVQNPVIISGVNNQQYVVTMTDAAQGCSATDTVVVSAYYVYADTVYNCNGQPVTLDFGPGASYYIWQFYTDPQGNTTVINQNSQTFLATAPGQYFGGGVFAGCGALTSVFTLIDSCSIQVGNVWPGDCNYDLVANMADALHIGMAYNATGATRPNATPLWYAQPMADWSQNFVNCNYKHADADGNGIVDVNDTLPISINYGNTHPYRLQPVVAPSTAPALYLVANYDTVGLQTLVTVDVRLGTSALPIDSLYGISFRITADAGLIDTTLTIINLNTTWLGTMNSNMFGFRKYFRTNGSVDAAESRNNLQNRLGGNGTIATFYIVTTDNLSGIAICHIKVTDVTAVTIGQTYLTLNTANDSVVIDPSVPAGIAPVAASTTFSAYPNPANNSVTVQTNVIATEIEICDMQGRTVFTVNPTSSSTALNTSQLAEGVYLLRVKNGKEVTTQKLSVTH